MFLADVNRHFINKIINQLDFKKFNNTFETFSFKTQQEFTACISNGWAFSAVHHKMPRKADNWKESWIIALDFDDSHPEDIVKTKPYKIFGSFIYTTPSHTPENPRCRAVWILTEPFTDPKQYALAVTHLTKQYKDEADASCKDPSRVFYGSKGCEIYWNNNTLPLATAQAWARQEALTTPRRIVVPAKDNSIHDAYTQKAITDELDILRNTSSGGRHNALLRAAVIIGGFVLAPWSYIGEQEAASMLYDAAYSIGLVKDDGERSVYKAIEDGFRYADPRPSPKDSVYEAIDPVTDFSLSNLMNAYRAGYEDGTKDTLKAMAKMFGIPELTADWYQLTIDGAGNLVLPYYGKEWSVTDIAHMSAHNITWDDGSYPIGFADPTNSQKDLLIISQDIGAALNGWVHGSAGWQRTEPDFVAVPKFSDVHAAPESFFDYNEVVIIGGAGSNLTHEDSKKLPNAGYIDLFDTVGDLFNKYGLQADTFKRMIAQAW